ncbi:MAG: UPF0182 family protein [Caldilineaceae bacterium]
MAERDPFRELLEKFNEDDWTTIEEELLDGGNGNDIPRRPTGGGGGGNNSPQGNPRLLWWMVIPFILISLFNGVLGFFTDLAWYNSLTLSSVYWTRITASVGLFLAGGAIFLLFFVANVLIARRLEPRGLDGSPLDQIAQTVGVRITPAVLLVGVVLAFFMGSGASAYWEDLLLYLNQTPFHLADPIFAKDVGFYIFTLPIWQIARNWMLTSLIMTLIASALVSGIGWRGWNASAAVRAHLSGLGALILLLIAWQYRLDALQLVYSTRGAVFGAGYTDVNAQLPAYNLLAIVTLITAVLLLVNVVLRQAWRAIVVVLVIWVAISALAGNIYPGIVQRLQVDPNEYTREESFILDNIEFTRIAFELNDIVEKNYNATGDLTAEGLLEQPETVRNIRLWDYRPLLQTYNQVQALRQQYIFNDIDIDRYTIDGERRQVMLAARELVPEQLEVQAQTWVNRKLVYTHGYGAAASPVAEITKDGLPTFILKDLPTQGLINVTRPEIYFGERSSGYVVVKTDTPEFDYPRNEGGNATTTFAADTGIPIGNFFTRLAFSLRFADVNLLISEELKPESELLWRRNIRERVEEVAPFLHYDHDAYLVISDEGRMYWFLDAYTLSNRFPYSEPSRAGTDTIPPGFNYIRNSVKIVIDAYTGAMKFYVVDEDEPIIAAYRKIFPDLFSDYAAMPADQKAHIRYPNDLFSIQANMFLTYQMTDPLDFYNREDMWAWPQEVFDDGPRPIEPYYVLMQLPDSQDLDFIQILPFTPANRENMIAWLAAQNDPEKYGQKLVYRFGKDSLIFGPKQIEARIDQDPVISSQLSLWNQQGSQVIRGNLLVIPISGSLLYVEPLYLQAASGKIPELKRVILATPDRVIMAENLGLALAELFGRDVLEDARLAELALVDGENVLDNLPSEPTTDRPGADLSQSTLDELIVEANTIYSLAQAALQTGDWAAYGTQMDALQVVLERLAEVSGVPLPPAEPSPTADPTPLPAPEPATEPETEPIPTPASGE